MSISCSFNYIVGGICSCNRRDRNKCTEVVPLLSCKRDISHHTHLWSITDVESEVDLILSRASIFARVENNLTICPSHRSSLGIGWRRGSNLCRVPQEIAEHKKDSKNVPKAERGIGKQVSQFILLKTGKFLPAGSGKILVAIVYYFVVA